jgi:hypothetical protein
VFGALLENTFWATTSAHLWLPGLTCKEEAAKLIALAQLVDAGVDPATFLKTHLWLQMGFLPLPSGSGN